MIPITKPFLPPIEEYERYLKDIWKRNWLTNDGPLAKELEQKLKTYLNVPNLIFVSNGTIALQIAIHALGLKDEIITTPFSFIATTSSIIWEHCEPVFVDIDENSFNISPSLIEAAITPKTTGILATHVYGNPCDIESIEKIAKKHNLKVIYDGAHCFGTRFKGRSVFEFGDITTASFHATKLFHTTEGGALITGSAELATKISRMKNFGFVDYDEFGEVGINGKNSELHAAMGLCNLKHIDTILNNRIKQSEYYDQRLTAVNLRRPLIHPDAISNYSYYPVLFESEESLLIAKKFLGENQIFTRRYFYPTLSSLGFVRSGNTPVADHIAQRVLCLPLYHDLKHEEIDLVSQMLIRVSKA